MLSYSIASCICYTVCFHAQPRHLLLHFCCWKNPRRMQRKHHWCPCFAGLVSDAFHLTFGCGLLTFLLFAMAASRTKPDNLYTYGSVTLFPVGFLCYSFFFLRSPVYTLQLWQKSNFQPSTTKPDNIGHLTVKIGQICPWGGFEGGFPFCED